MSSSHDHHEGGVVDTLQSLIVAFVLAMTFRGFVAEGFVIPTGSMAPTLMGMHRLVHSEVTGYTFPVGLDQARMDPMIDPMLGQGYFADGLRPVQDRPRSGDRILVIKTIYPFSSPGRWDVVVFKNPTDPKSEAGNYIKRLIGLPNETIWIADGDIFAKPAGEADYAIQRKPEHVQRAMWQPVHHTDYPLVNPQLMRLGHTYPGPPWRGDQWNTSGRAYRCDTDQPTTLHWESASRRLDDWAMYNMLTPQQPGDLRRMPFPVSDVRVAAGIVADQPGLETTFELEARGHVYQFSISGGQARVRYRAEDEDLWINEVSAQVAMPRPGRVMNVEFWHVDQAMRLFIEGREAVRLEYDWSPMERLEHATGRGDDSAVDAASYGRVRGTALRWHFSGSPVTLHRVRTDRDVSYRGGTLGPVPTEQNPPLHGNLALVANDTHAFGTHPDKPAELGPDHFFMLGDNTQASLDSRVWKNPHLLVAEQIDPAPFVVHRKLLLGKAWVVYFPAMHAVTPRGPALVPDFGRLRYIR